MTSPNAHSTAGTEPTRSPLNLTRTAAALAAAGVLCLALTSCGGNPSSTDAGTASGAAVKGPLFGATICAYRVDNAATDKKGTLLSAASGSTPSVSNGCVVTGSAGTFSLVLPAGTTGDVLFESSGGTYCSDESTYNGTACAGTDAAAISMGSTRLRTVVVASSGAMSPQLTLLTTAAVNAAGSTLSASSFASAYSTVANRMGVSTDPTSDPNATGTLKTLLTRLASYLGGDVGQISSVVTALGNGNLTGSGGSLTIPASAGTTVTCRGFSQAEANGAAVLRFCVPQTSGSGVSQLEYQVDGLGSGTLTTKNIVVKNYAGTECAGPVIGEAVPAQARYLGTATHSLTLSTVSGTATSGVISRYSFTAGPSTALGNTTTTTFGIPLCVIRTVGTSVGETELYAGDRNGPKVGGMPTRFNTSKLEQSYTD